LKNGLSIFNGAVSGQQYLKAFHGIYEISDRPHILVIVFSINFLQNFRIKIITNLIYQLHRMEDENSNVKGLFYTPISLLTLPLNLRLRTS
jgi:hypothetical protein